MRDPADAPTAALCRVAIAGVSNAVAVTADDLAGESVFAARILDALRAQYRRGAAVVERQIEAALTSAAPPLPYPDEAWWERLLRRPPPPGFSWTRAECRAILVGELHKFYCAHGYPAALALKIAEHLATSRGRTSTRSPTT